MSWRACRVYRWSRPMYSRPWDYLETPPSALRGDQCRHCSDQSGRPRPAASGTSSGSTGPVATYGLRSVWHLCTALERKQLVILFASSGMLNLGFGVIIPVLPALSQQLGFGATGIGLLLAIPSLARVIFNLPAGALVDRSGRVPAMVVGQLAAAVGCIGTAFGSSLIAMLPFRFLGGAGSAIAAAGAQAYLVDMTEQPHLRPFRGTIVGAQAGLIAASYVFGPAIGGAIAQFYGPTVAYCFVAGILTCCAGAFACLPEIKSGHRIESSHGSHLNTSLKLLRQAALDWRTLLKDANQQGLCMANVALYLNYAAGVAVIPLQASQVFGTSPGELGALYAVGAGIGILLAPAAGRVTDRYGRVPLVLPAITGCAASCYVIGCTQQWETFVLAYMLWCVGEAILAPALTAYAADISPKAQAGAALSLSRQAQDVVFLVGPVGLGVIYDFCPGPAAMVVTAGLSMAGGVMFRMRATDVRQ